MEEAFQRLFGQVVRERRDGLGLSQEAAAERIGVHRTYVGSVERGERNLSLRNILRIGVALGVPASILLAEVEGRLPAAR